MRHDHYATRASALVSAQRIAEAKGRHNLARSIADELHRLREDVHAGLSVNGR